MKYLKSLLTFFAIMFFLNVKPLLAYDVYPIWGWAYNFNGNVTSTEYHGNYIYTTISFSDSAFIIDDINLPNTGGVDAAIVKWDTMGHLIWAKRIGGSANENIVSVHVNINNEVIVAGTSNSGIVDISGTLLTSNGGVDIVVAKFDQNGNIVSTYLTGTAGNEYCVDMCTDAQNNIYLFSNGGIQKYTSLLQFISQLYIPGVREIDFSPYDSTIVVTGSYTGNYTLGPFTISADGNGTNTYCAKISPVLSVLWLNAIGRGNIMGQYSATTDVDEITGKIYVGRIAYYQITLDHMIITQISPMGSKVNAIDENSEWWNVNQVEAISVNWPYVAVTVNGGLKAILLYDLNNLNNWYGVKFIQQSGSGGGLPEFLEVRNMDIIYTLGFENNQFRKFGKISPMLVAANPYQTVEACAGSVYTLADNTQGGTPPFTYSWLPVTGLNNTNTLTVNFTASSNIIYTLTVTDSLGQVAKDTFDIIVQNPIPAANITSQFPAICDSMKLYANNGVAGGWYQFLPANNQWQLLGTDTAITIFAAGTYRYEKSNACNNTADTITVAGNVFVNALASSDSICAGQSITLNGSGALSYSWSGGVQNNIPFIPQQSQTYTVTGTDANGCTNTSYVNISILSSKDSTTLSICNAQTPYVWHGQNLNNSGLYNAVFTNMYGCDSTEYLNLTVSPCVVCVPNIVINYSPFYNALTESQSWILTSGTVLIPTGITVKLDANTNSYVKLNPGFKVEHGAVFVAQALNGCTAGSPQLPNAKIYKAEAGTPNEIVLYPNPTTGLIHINHDEKLSSIQIFDMVGKLVISQKCNGEIETNIDLSHLPNGVYHVKAAGYNAIKVVKK
jgi:hypothetical protein